MAGRVPLLRGIALIGLSGAGKSTVAPLLAARVGGAWIDLDRSVEETSGRAVAALVPHPRDGSVFAIGRDGAVLRVVPAIGSTTTVAPVGTFPRETRDAEISPDGELLLAPNLQGDNIEV